jgi:hypothetical protein
MSTTTLLLLLAVSLLSIIAQEWADQIDTYLANYTPRPRLSGQKSEP